MSPIFRYFIDETDTYVIQDEENLESLSAFIFKYGDHYSKLFLEQWTTLYVCGQKLFENDIVIWEGIGKGGSEYRHICKVIWCNDDFTGWGLQSLETESLRPIPIGTFGADIADIKIIDNVHSYEKKFKNFLKGQ